MPNPKIFRDKALNCSGSRALEELEEALAAVTSYYRGNQVV